MERARSLELGVLFLDDHQTRERPAEVVLCLLKRREFGGIGEVFARHLDAARARARLGHLHERVFLVLRRRLHRRDEVRDEVVAALELRVEVGPLLLGGLISLDEEIVLLATGEEARESEREHGEDGLESRHVAGERKAR